ncbi:MAG TPA: Sua5/YciO/YrdC/YwlC family protein [Gemmataceae bacterium]|nr:Sua5/YciO/YrdC/YwlC family protein [Gemmataceae bacterium]
MSAFLHPWQPNESCNLVIRHLVGGDCVALPTEAGYELVASALNDAAVQQLRDFGQPAFVISDYAELANWLPLLRGPGARLFRKMGPGPIVLQADAGFAMGLWRRLPEAVRQATVADGCIAVRWPDHPIWSELRQAGLPLVSMSIDGAITAQDAERLVGAKAGCIIDDGSATFAAPPTIVRTLGRRCVVQRPGAITAEQVEQLGQCRIVFVCTGNTCRSPMAQVLCTKMLADALACAIGEISEHGFHVHSAGLAAMVGSEASPAAVTIVGEFGADLSRHASRMLTLDDLQWADFLFGMTAGHCYTLESIPAAMPMPRLLRPDGADIADPIGGAFADYKTCAHQILECLRQRLPELLEA